MKIVVTGSLGHISKPLVEQLIRNGHIVTVISSSPDKIAAIEAFGALAAIGSVRDRQFLKETFNGADAVYTMVPPVNYFDADVDAVAFFSEIGHNYADAIRNAGITRVVNLSSWGAHRDNGNGGIAGAYYLEQIMNELPEEISLTHLRPTSFYYNLYAFIPVIKNAGIIAASYGGDDITALVAPSDIAAVIAEELDARDHVRNVRYVASDELSCNEVASILGAAIGKPDLKWVVIPGEQLKGQLEAAGMPSKMAASLVELQEGHHSGLIAEDYKKNRPAMREVKMVDFAKEFAQAFHQK